MLPTIATGNVGSALAGEFEVANSLRFDDGSSDYLNKTNGTPTNNDICTLSFWCKLGFVGSDLAILSQYTDSNNRFQLFRLTSGALSLFQKNGGSTEISLTTNRLFRDLSAWYHIVISMDTSQATASNRIKLYINGSQETSFSVSTYPSQNANIRFNSSSLVQDIGRVSSDYYDGYMAEVCFIDGQALDPTSFGEFDEDSSIWKPIDVSCLTFGTNGFYLDFENSGSLGADVSGNGNNFTVNNLTSIDQTTDTPTNNFDTANPLIANGNVTYAEGNLQTSHTYASQWRWTTSTIGVDTGKWYAEFKVSALGTEIAIGIMPEDAINGNQNSGNDFVGKFTDSVAYLYNGQIYKSNSIDNTTSTYTTNDIIGIALDLDSNSIQFYKNGSSVGTAVSLTANKNYFFGCAGYNTAIILWNFGNPPFTISSGNSDGNGYGNFEYSVPSGYYALNTKNLAEYG